MFRWERTSENPETVITSSDGAARLTVPRGALPSGVDVSDLSISLAQNPEEFAGFPGVVTYELGPSGVRFESPAEITFELEASGAELPLVTLLDESGVELVSGVHSVFDHDIGRLVVSVPVAHFSRVTAMTRGLFSLESYGIRKSGKYFVGEKFPWILNFSTVQTVDPFSGRGVAVTATDVSVSGTLSVGNSGILSPAFVVDMPSKFDRDLTSMKIGWTYVRLWDSMVEFTCLRPGTTYIKYAVRTFWSATSG